MGDVLNQESRQGLSGNLLADLLIITSVILFLYIVLSSDDIHKGLILTWIIKKIKSLFTHE